jgi:F0F1-type ATP synthase gamma subunit
MIFFLFLLTVKMRITGTKNIAKITKSMKMVSAAKLRGDQQRLTAAQPFAVSDTWFFSAVFF